MSPGMMSAVAAICLSISVRKRLRTAAAAMSAAGNSEVAGFPASPCGHRVKQPEVMILDFADRYIVLTMR